MCTTVLEIGADVFESERETLPPIEHKINEKWANLVSFDAADTHRQL